MTPDLLHAILVYKYWILFPLACVEGPIIALIGGFLISLGYLSIAPTYLLLILGNVLPDLMYYAIGRFGKKRIMPTWFGRRIGLTEEKLVSMKRMWHAHPLKSMLAAKSAYWLSTPLLVTAGLVQMPLSRFLLYSVPINFAIYAVLLGLGYYSGNSYLVLSHYIRSLQIIVAVVLLLALVGYLLYRRFGKKPIQNP